VARQRKTDETIDVGEREAAWATRIVARQRTAVGTRDVAERPDDLGIDNPRYRWW
jgi:hypothetical protein